MHEDICINIQNENKTILNTKDNKIEVLFYFHLDQARIIVDRFYSNKLYN